MGLIDQAREDIKAITSDTVNGFGVDITIITPSDITVVIPGLHSKHHLGVDTEGNPVNAKNAHISFSESVLLAKGVSIRNANKEISLKDYQVKVKDSTGLLCHYVIKSWYPNETTGLIVCILGDYE